MFRNLDRSCPFFLLIARGYQCPDLPDEHQLQESLRHPLKNKSLKPMRPVCPQLRSATSNSIQCTSGHDPRRWNEKAFIHIISWAFHASNYHTYHLYIMVSRSPWYSLPAHLCRFGVRVPCQLARSFSRQHRISDFAWDGSASRLRMYGTRIYLGPSLHAYPRTTNAWAHLSSCVPPLLSAPEFVGSTRRSSP